MTVKSRGRPTVLNRSEAAAMLRAASSSEFNDEDARGECIGWTLSALPNSLVARKLKIDYLLECGHFDSADALIARCLMQGKGRAAGPLLRLRLACSLHAQGRLDQAAVEIERVLAARPADVRALTLATRIAQDGGRPGAAIEFIERAIAVSPERASLRHELIESLLEAGSIERAAAELQRLPGAPPLLAARVLRAQQRTLEAVEQLEQELARKACGPALVSELIDAIEELGDGKRLRDAMDHHRDDGSAVSLRIARAMLAHGRFDAAARLCIECKADPAMRHDALATLLIAQISAGNIDAAEITLEDLGKVTVRQRQIAGLWLTAMRGELVHRSETGGAAGRDPIVSLLQPMLRNAAELFRSRMANADEGELPGLHGLLRTCTTAMGMNDAAVVANAPVNATNSGKPETAPTQLPRRKAA